MCPARSRRTHRRTLYREVTCNIAHTLPRHRSIMGSMPRGTTDGSSVTTKMSQGLASCSLIAAGGEDRDKTKNLSETQQKAMRQRMRNKQEQGMKRLGKEKKKESLYFYAQQQYSTHMQGPSRRTWHLHWTRDSAKSWSKTVASACLPVAEHRGQLLLPHA